MATEEKKPDAESTKTQSTPSSSTNQSKVCVWGSKKYPCKNTWNYLNSQQPDQNQGFEFSCTLRSFPCGCFCWCLVLRILWEKGMECRLCCSAKGSLLVLEKFSVVKYFCQFEHDWDFDWRIGESCGVGKQLFRFFEDAQRRCYCLTMKPFQRVKVGFKGHGGIGLWFNSWSG